MMMMIVMNSSAFYTPIHQANAKPPIFPSNNNNINNLNNLCYAVSSRPIINISSKRALHTSTITSSSSNQGVAVETSLTSFDSASTVVRKFYEGINAHDLGSVDNLIADNCVYDDLIFPQPFVGRKAILDFFKKFIDSFSTDLQFVIDDISEDDVSRVGVTWHLEWKGKSFPFSKGCSFYRLEVLNGQRQIVYGRDSVEPAIKPGESALVAIRGITWLLQQFPQLAERL